MKIERIIGMTRDIGKPLNWNEATMGPCESLPVRDEIIGNANCMISAHRPTPEDLALLAAGEPLLLGIYGTVHPVTFMTVGYSPEYKAAFRKEFDAKANHIPDVCKMIEPVQSLHKLPDEDETEPAKWAEINAWLETTFGPISPYRMVERAEEEFSELRDAVNSGESEEAIDEEAADVVMCLMRRPGLWAALLRKYAINQGRSWNLHGDGTGHHIKGVEDDAD
jgi:hypothetical protein